jgi:hypothetical protein
MSGTTPENVHSASAIEVGCADGARPRSTAGRLVLAVPLRGKAAREAHPARAVLRRHDPDDGAARPGEASREKCVCLLQRRCDIGGENGVVCAGGQLRRIPSAGEHMRGVIEARQPRPHACRGLDRGPAAVRRAQSVPELPAASADIEQIADFSDALPDEWRHARNIVGGVDARGVELDRIDGVGVAGEARHRVRRSCRRRPIQVVARRDGHGAHSQTMRHRELPPSCTLPANGVVQPGLATSGHPAQCARA